MVPSLRLPFTDVLVVLGAHGLLGLVAFVAGTIVAVRRARDPSVVLASAPLIALAALVGARLLFVLVRGGGFGVRGGLMSAGGVAAGLLATWAAARLSGVRAARLFDAIAPGAILALGIGRIGCFLAGCCYGRPTALPWGVVFDEIGPEPRHPLQLYSAAFDFALVRHLLGVGGVPGTVTRRACVGLGLGRALLELLRDAGSANHVAGTWLTLAQMAGIALAVGGIVLTRERARPAPSRLACDGGIV